MTSLKRGDAVRVMLGGGQLTTVHAGILDDAARHAYSLGQCGALALALAEKIGWPIVFLGTDTCFADRDAGCSGSGYPDHPTRDKFGVPGFLCPCQVWHFGVRRPDGQFVDINGPRPLVAAKRERDADWHARARASLLTDVRRGDFGWPKPNMAAAHLFADAILAPRR